MQIALDLEHLLFVLVDRLLFQVSDFKIRISLVHPRSLNSSELRNQLGVPPILKLIVVVFGDFVHVYP